MKENPLDKTKEGIVERMGWAREKFRKDFKGVKPFNKDPIPDDFLIKYYDNMSLEDEGYIRQTYGDEAVQQRFYDVEQLKLRRK